MMTDRFSLDPLAARHFLALWDAYEPTPLTQIPHAGHPVWVKDETARMGLGSFKALGGGYAVARLIEAAVGGPLSPEEFRSEAVRKVAATLTFVTASAGNHGLAVANGARVLGAKARIHLAETVPQSFVERLEAVGATAVRSGQTYEDSIQAAIADADARPLAIHLADGSWEGYTEPPRLVMEGYTVLGEELRLSFEEKDVWPSHVYLQAGVGGMAAAVAYMIRETWQVQPQICVVEPDAAPCLAESVKAGCLTTVAGPVSNMGRLDCKDASLIAFEILKATADSYVQISDVDAVDAVTQLAGHGLATTPSGAAGWAAMRKDGLPPEARPLVIVSEGAVA